MKIIDKLKSLDLDLPNTPEPVGSYLAVKKMQNLLYISGQLPFMKNGKIITGKVGDGADVKKAQEAAHYCCLNIIAQLNKFCNGDLDKVLSCIKITGFVNSTKDFTDQPKVINSASDLLVKVFGEKGKHTRAAVSVNSLPLGAVVEIDSIFEIK